MTLSRDRLPRALELLRQGRLTEAAAIYQVVLRYDPNHPEALHYLGLIALQTGRTGQGVRLIGRAIARKPDMAQAYNHYGIGLAALGRYDEALDSYDKAIALQPGFPEAYDNRGSTLFAFGRFEDAITSYDQAITLKPGDPRAYTNRGSALRGLRQYEDALASHDKAIILKPDFANAHHNRGVVLLDLGRFGEALSGFDHAITLSPDNAGAYNGRGTALSGLQRHDEALESFDRAIALKADHVQAHVNRGNTLQSLHRFADAFESYDIAIGLDPSSAEAHANRGDTLLRLLRYQDALASYEQAIALRPRLDTWYGNYIYTKRQICDWAGEDAISATLADEVIAGRCVSMPFQILGIVSESDIQRKVAEIVVQARHPASNVSPPAHGSHERIRIGYFSSAFRDHAIMYQVIGLFEQHDQSRFELTAFSFGPDVDSPITQRITGLFDRFIDVRIHQDQEIAQLARMLEIDIAIDLTGFTTHGRPGIFSCRAAPIQINYLGYPGTMGTAYFDYIIADPVVVPTAQRQHYVEKIVWLPNSYMPSDPNRPIAPTVFTRTALGLPESGFVFCCFNAPYKITPQIFDVWMRILAAVPRSVLWLFEENAVAVVNLRKEAAISGIDPDRLIFAERMPPPEHLARHRAADLFLDTRPYNAHTTASDALWAGLPVLTYPGDTFASRVAASLLTAIGLPELIVPSLEAYETLAVELATQPDRLDAIKIKLAANRLTAPAFDTQQYTSDLEAAFTAMVARHHAGLPPEDMVYPFAAPPTGGAAKPIRRSRRR